MELYECMKCGKLLLKRKKMVTHIRKCDDIDFEFALTDFAHTYEIKHIYQWS
jgi:ribosomal protein L37AE/L43A